MNRPFALAIIAATGITAGCPSSDGDRNPPVLWLDLDGSETEVRLIDHEPSPY
ncbi:MAG: hypothetical protein AB7P03_30650 [Kofleriaceae bacterium]